MKDIRTMYTPFFHSNYGLGGSDFKTIFDYLEKYKLKSCGLIDETFFGLPEFLKYARAYRIKPVIGARIPVHFPLASPSSTPASGTAQLPPDRAAPQFLYLFVKNQTGYENLCALLTAHAFGRCEPALIKDHGEGIVLLSDSVPALKELRPFFNDIFFLLLPGHAVYCPDFPAFAANEVFYVTPEEKIICRLMATIKKHQGEIERSNPHHLLTRHEFYRSFVENPEAIKNNQRLQDLCDFIPGDRNWVFPGTDENLYEIIKPRYKNLNREQKNRADYEYRIIKNMGFEPYFILVHRLKEYARAKGIGMNVRGSAASSFILYLLDLSVVNPLVYNLPFERFLNPQRTEPPDIDVDVEFNQREKLIKEIYKKFGADHVAQIAVINRFQRKARFRDTARAYGVSPQELKTIKDHAGEYLINRVRGLAERIDGFPHYFSCHPSGIVIAPRPVYKYVPLYPSPAGKIIHFDKEGIEITGLVKIDILGVRGFPELFLSKEKVNFDDPAVYNFIRGGTTLGCFQIESPAVRHMIKNIKPKTLIDIANAIAIIRPGPAAGGMKELFVRRLHGEEKVEHLHPVLAETLADTLGIPIYQEQILQIASNFANFSLSEGDMLRRAITKERDPKNLQATKELFFERAKLIGYKMPEIEKVWHRIAVFSSFGFNKAHSTTYATLAYLSAYQKFHYPLDFFRRVINNKGGYYPTYAYINDARRRGLEFLGPDVNKSEFEFKACHAAGALLTGLGEIKNLSSATIKRILKFRPFKTPEEFFTLAAPEIDEGTALIKSGALDCFGEPWPRLYFILLNASHDTRARCRCDSRTFKALSNQGQNMFCGHKLLSDKTPDFTDFPQKLKLQEQFKTIGFFPGCHPLEFLYPGRKVRIVDAENSKAIEIIGLLIARRIVLTKTKKLMSFLTLDDETGILEAIVFPGKYRPRLSGPVLRVNGIIKDDSMITSYCTNLSTLTG